MTIPERDAVTFWQWRWLIPSRSGSTPDAVFGFSVASFGFAIFPGEVS